MELVTLLAWIILLTLGFSFLIPYIWFRNNTNKMIKEYLLKSKEFSDNNFIEATKYEFNKQSSIIQTGLMMIFAGFVALRVVGVMPFFAYTLTGYLLVGGFVLYIKLNELHHKVVSALYLQKR